MVDLREQFRTKTEALTTIGTSPHSFKLTSLKWVKALEATTT